MLVKVSELEGRALNYAVAVCEWGQPRETDAMFVFDTGNERGQEYVHKMSGDIQIDEFDPSGNWLHFGPLIDIYKIDISHAEEVATAAGIPDENGHLEWMVGEDSLQAGCRALALCVGNDFVEIPDELVEV